MPSAPFTELASTFADTSAAEPHNILDVVTNMLHCKHVTSMEPTGLMGRDVVHGM